MRLRTKFAIVLIAAALVLSGVVYFGLESSEQRAIAEHRATVHETAEFTADQIDASLRRQTNYVGYYASTTAARDFENSSPFLDAFLTSPRFYAAELVAANGTVVDVQGDVTAASIGRTVGTDHSEYAFVQHPLETGETYVSPPERVTETGELVIVVSAPIFNDSAVVGVLVAAAPLNEATLFSVVEPVETEEQAVSIIGGDRHIREPHRTFEHAITEQAVVDRTGWRVVVDRNRQPLNDRLQQLAYLQGASLLVVFGVIVSLAFVEYEILLKQTNRLLAGFDAFRRGNYDYELTLSGGEEWTTIADRFAVVGEALSAREAKLRESEQRLSVLNRVLRHNLRNDMTIVLNYSKRIAEDADAPDIRDAAQRIATKADDLVRLGEGARQVEDALAMQGPRPIDVADATRRAVAEVRRDAPKADLTVDVPDESITMTVHPAFDRAVACLVDNAIRHNDSTRPEVDVILEHDGETVRVSVADDGPGLPAMEAAVLSDDAETQLEHGSGLGLWLAHWVVQKSNGDLTFETRDTGGTLATIRLPAEPSDAGTE